MEKGIFNKNKIFNINLLYVLSLIPIVAYTYYKNGIIMLQHDKMNFFNTMIDNTICPRDRRYCRVTRNTVRQACFHRLRYMPPYTGNPFHRQDNIYRQEYYIHHRYMIRNMLCRQFFYRLFLLCT